MAARGIGQACRRRTLHPMDEGHPRHDARPGVGGSLRRASTTMTSRGRKPELEPRLAGRVPAFCGDFRVATSCHGRHFLGYFWQLLLPEVVETTENTATEK